MKNLNLKMNNRTLLRLCALLMALALFAGSALLPGSAAPTEEELQQKMEQVEDRIQQRQREIEELRKEKKEQEKLIPVLEAQVKEIDDKAALIDQEIEALNSSVRQLRGRIEGLSRQIEECQATILRIQTETEDKRVTIDFMQEQLKERLRQQYMAGPVSNLQLLLSSPDLTSFLTVAEYIRTQAERDAAMRKQLEAEMADLLRLEKEQEAEQANLEARRGDLERENDALEMQLQEQRRAKKDLDAQRERISEAQSELYAIIYSLEKQTADAKRLLEADRKAMQEFEDKLDALLREKKKNGTINPDNLPIVEGQMTWPVPTSKCYISSPFGATQNRSYPHEGLDISATGANNTDYPIIAALDGIVLDYGWTNSRGNYIVLYHGYYAPKGKEIKTTYMHLRSIDSCITDGAKIKAGKVIGIMGSTGNSTGAHLHFKINEIASDGKSRPVNPLNYVKNPYK